MTKERTSKQKKVVRKPSTDPAIHRYYFKLDAEENAQFKAMFVRSGLDNKIKFIKSILFNRTIKVVKIDKSLQDSSLRLTHIYVQFQKIGNNYNHLVKALKTNFGEKRARILLNGVERRTIELVVLSR
ncbi:MAG: MobA protein [Tannerellaceae bacterium]|nr:MobA protein [Tannerellaceae bacterium]